MAMFLAALKKIMISSKNDILKTYTLEFISLLAGVSSDVPHRRCRPINIFSSVLYISAFTVWFTGSQLLSTIRTNLIFEPCRETFIFKFSFDVYPHQLSAGALLYCDYQHCDLYWLYTNNWNRKIGNPIVYLTCALKLMLAFF